MGTKLICTCGEVVDVNDLIREKIFAGNEIEPPEYRYTCPHCGQDEIEMDEYLESEDEDGI